MSEYKSKTFTGLTPEEAYQKYSDDWEVQGDGIIVVSSFWQITGEWHLFTVVYYEDLFPHM